MIKKVEDLTSGYRGGRDMPLAGYLTLLGIFNAGLVALLAANERKGDSGEGAIKAADVLLLGVATFRLARLVAKDRVTSPLRAPFVEYVRPDGADEVQEKSRGAGLQRAVGDLVTCPWCVSPWVAGALGLGMVFRPRATRLLTGIFAAVAVADVAQHGYSALKKKTE